MNPLLFAGVLGALACLGLQGLTLAACVAAAYWHARACQEADRGR